MFWRASVSSQYTMSLDPVDAEAFRRYLIGERGFPDNAAVVAIF
ncbi:MAG TPA: hypothetical protein VGF76_15500 [Polyangiaceae bacterium]